MPYEIDVTFLKEFKKMIDSREGRFILVCGGGRTARSYQDAASQIEKLDESELDWIGIGATKVNAELVRAIFGKDAFEKVITDPFEKVDFQKILVCSGWKPGRSTDYVAVQMAKNYGCGTVINMSNVNYVYDKDPKKNKGARPLHKMNYEELQKIVGTEWKPGMNAPFDPVAAKLAWEEKKKVVIMGADLRNLKNFLEEKEFNGTVIEDES